MSSFARQVSEHIDKYKRRTRAVAKQSVEDVVEVAQTPTAKGGRMRVDTGFLRSSGGAALGEPPKGPSSQGDGGQSGEPLPVALAKWDLNQPLYWGWTAEYASARELKDGFARGAAELFPRFVENHAKRIAKL